MHQPTFDNLILTAANGSWQLRHPADRLQAVGELSVHGEPAWQSAICRMGDTSDEVALVEDVRGTRKGQQVIISTRGYLPFGSQPIFNHTTRCTDGLLRVTTDLSLRHHTQLRRDVEIGSLELAGGWVRWRCLQADPQGELVLTPWTPLESPLDWPEPPLALILERQDGVQIEIGTGSDIWRWRDGIEERVRPPSWRLEPSDAGWRLRRIVGSVDEECEARSREYRFSWYAAWRSSHDVVMPLPQRVLDWDSAGRLESGQVAAIADGECISIDTSAMAWPPAFIHTGNALPCFGNSSTGKRLRKVVRQLDALRDRSFTTILQGLRPAVCQNGSHVGRPGERLHWDINGLVDFMAWAQHTLGPERPIFCDPADLATPALLNLSRLGEVELEEV